MGFLLFDETEAWSTVVGQGTSDAFQYRLALFY